MKNANNFLKMRYVFPVALTFLVGCSSVKTTAPMPVTLTSTKNIVSSSVFPTESTLVATPIPTTYQPTLLLINPSDGTATPTFEIIPVPQKDYKNDKLINLLQNNNSCEYPCFWGITPGKTRWNTTLDFIKALGGIVSGRQLRDVKLNEVNFSYDDGAASVWIQVFERDNLVVG